MNTPDNDRFDDALRQLHAHAVSRVSAGTSAELHRRRHAVLAQKSPHARRWFGWPAAAALASVLGLAMALGFGLQRDEAIPASAPVAAATDTPDELEDTYATLDENPDFYLWLASSDATLLAME